MCIEIDGRKIVVGKSIVEVAPFDQHASGRIGIYRCAIIKPHLIYLIAYCHTVIVAIVRIAIPVVQGLQIGG